jgi:vancomycin aglycone glucosyltransferase
MRVLLSTIGSRGDVQPLVALGLKLKALGHVAHVCAPPDFQDWVEGFGLAFTPVGVSVRSTAKAPAMTAPPSAEQMLQIAKATVAGQFEALSAAAEGHEVLVGANALQIALRTVAELKGARYVFASYCPVTLPSAQHAPPSWRGDTTASSAQENTRLWQSDGERWNASWGAVLNEQRVSLGLQPAEDVRSHIFTKRPWLAADPVLAPWPDDDDAVFQTGAWLLPDERPLPSDLERFLDAGDPPVYVGFGSVRAPDGAAANMIAAARAVGRRVIVLRGWADLVTPDAPDVFAIDEVSQSALFRRVSVAAHHGGAGTTTAAALSGTPQLVMPQLYDQPYWARRVEELGAGVALAGSPSIQEIAAAIDTAQQQQARAAAQRLAGAIRKDGAERAAHALTN